MDNILIDNSKTIYIVIFIAFNYDFSLPKFINMFFCLLIFLKPNSISYFKLVNIL